MSPPPDPTPAEARPAEEDPEGWAGADELATRHAVSRRTIFRWLAAGQVTSRDVAGVTQYRVVGARAPGKPRGATPPPPSVTSAPPGERADLADHADRVEGAESGRHAAGEPLPELVAELAERLERVETLVAQVGHRAPTREARGEARSAAGELEQARLLTELATRHAEQSRADLIETKRVLAETRRALEIERERAYRLALVATLPWWQLRARREMLAEIAAMQALALPAGDDADG